ncbi:MAG: hypothetical protein MRZ79_17645 [Bacteroidia bacterium]|nr:hypothetical protein [Bacteroidia bacterium]
MIPSSSLLHVLAQQETTLAPGQVHIDLLRLIFDWELSSRQLARFRGAICQEAGASADVFHNHDPKTGKNLYRYPFIQYRLHQGKAMLLGFAHGADALDEFLQRWDGALEWDGDVKRPEILLGKRELLFGQPSEKMKPYILQDWLALNQENFRWWKETSSLTRRVSRLEEILTAQFLMLAKAMKWNIHWDLQMQITDIKRERTMSYRNVPRIGFDISFEANVDIPRFLAVGKAVSEGFGRIWPE